MSQFWVKTSGAKNSGVYTSLSFGALPGHDRTGLCCSTFPLYCIPTSTYIHPHIHTPTFTTTHICIHTHTCACMHTHIPVSQIMPVQPLSQLQLLGDTQVPCIHGGVHKAKNNYKIIWGTKACLHTAVTDRSSPTNITLTNIWRFTGTLYTWQGTYGYRQFFVNKQFTYVCQPLLHCSPVHPSSH